jgi:hypothetical protein
MDQEEEGMDRISTVRKVVTGRTGTGREEQQTPEKGVVPLDMDREDMEGSDRQRITEPLRQRTVETLFLEELESVFSKSHRTLVSPGNRHLLHTMQITGKTVKPEVMEAGMVRATRRMVIANSQRKRKKRKTLKQRSRKSDS